MLPFHRCSRRTLTLWLVVAGLLTAGAAVPLAAVAHPGHSPGGRPCPTGNPLTSPTRTAFSLVGAPAPSAELQTVQGCAGEYVVKATTAADLRVGNSYVLFFTVHSLDTGEPVDIEATLAVEEGAVLAGASSGANLTYVAARVHGAPGLRAVTLQPVTAGTITVKVQLPIFGTAGVVTLTARGGDADTQDQPDGPSGGSNGIPGFGAGLLVAGVLAAVALMAARRRGPGGRGGAGGTRGGRGGAGRLLSLLLVAAMVAVVAPPAVQGHGGHACDVSPVGAFNSDSSGFTVASEGALSRTFRAQVDREVLVYDFGDFTTGEGPDASHTYPEDGRYIAHLVAYDPGTLQGRVYTNVVEAGDSNAFNEAPLATMTVGTRWVTFGDNVTLNASGSTEVNDDALRYVWALGSANVSELTVSELTNNVTRFVQTVTERPVWTWQAPAAEGDYALSLMVVDSRRKCQEVTTPVRVTETLPDATAAFGPYNETLLIPWAIPDNTDGTGADEAEKVHPPFTMEYPGTVTVTVSFGPDPAETSNTTAGVPDVDVELLRVLPDGTTENVDDTAGDAASNPKVLKVGGAGGIPKGDYQVRVYLDKGLNVEYKAQVDVEYILNPFT